MKFNYEKIDEYTLALLYLAAMNDEFGGASAWKSFDWDTMDRLHQKGFISNPKHKAKSVMFSPEGKEKMETLFRKHFAIEEEMPSIVEKIGENTWGFIENESIRNHFSVLHEAEELIEIGNYKQALTIFKKIMQAAPLLVEAYNDYFLCLLYSGKNQQAFNHLKESVSFFLDQLPEELLSNREHKLSWLMLENRPFLRLYGNLANEYYQRNEFQKALDIFDRILSWNPNDNQGFRELKVKICLELNLLDEAEATCDSYQDDYMAGILYGKALVLLMKGESAKAKKHIKHAIAINPEIAKELLKKKHKQPKNYGSGYVIVGGEDEAYEYWINFGKHWENTPGALKLLEEVRNKLKA